MSSVSASQSQQTRLKDILPYLIAHFTGTDPLTFVCALMLYTLTLAIELGSSAAARYCLARIVFFPFYVIALILDVLQKVNGNSTIPQSVLGFQQALVFINSSTHIAGLF